MDTIQLTIIAVVIVLILVTIGYYLYQEAKFKKMVENNFNQATRDVIIEENKTFTLDGVDAQKQVNTQILQKDVIHKFDEPAGIDPLFDMQEAASTVHANVKDEENIFSDTNTVDEVVYPEHSVEAFFADIHKVTFPYCGEVSKDLDFIVDIGFEEVKKIKVLPEISQFTNKPFKFYVLDKHDQWSVFTKGEKYTLRALKLVVQLVDHEGIISQAQLANIYNELHKFVMQNEAHIYKSDYEMSIAKIQNQIKYLEKIELNLNIYLITQESYSSANLIKFFAKMGLIDNQGILQLQENNRLVFQISAENGAAFESGKSYNLLQITAGLHKQLDPNYTIEKIFDCAEKTMQNIESRLLTSNKRILEQKDYDAILLHVKKYVDSAKLNGIKLGGDLISRLF